MTGTSVSSTPPGGVYPSAVDIQSANHPKVDFGSNVKEGDTLQEWSELSTIVDSVHLAAPDGGTRAWLVILGAYLDLFSTFGVVNSYGVFQNYYTTALLPTSSPSVISLIGSLQLFLLYGLSPVIGRIYDAYGSTLLLPLGSFLTVLSMMLLSLCQEGKTYQFFLCQGVLFGIGNALVFTPALAVVGHWFKRRRAFAIGIVASGSSLGGVVYPIMLQRLIPAVGFGWAVRISGFLTLACLSVSCLTMKTRLPLKRVVYLRDAVDFQGFKDLRYFFSAIGAFLSFYALFIPYFYIEQYADFQGVSPNLSRYLLSILNALGIPARIIPGLLADTLGPLNILTPSMLISGLLVLCLWLPAHNATSVATFASLYGLFSGAFVSLLPSYIATISPVEKFGARLGSIYMVVSVANLIGTPTAGAFLRKVDQQHFNGLIIFTGVLVMAGCFTYSIARFVHSRRILSKI